MRIGVIGCGNISGIYLQNLSQSGLVEIAGCADIDELRARKSGFPVMTPEAMLGDPSVELILCLTLPASHAEIGRRVLESNKHLYCEKPLATSRTDGRELIDLAAQKKLRVGCAPDTFLGAGVQTARQAVQDGLIGEVVGGNMFMMCHGHEGWHPDPEFYYQVGGGPLFDMGPYYLTALVEVAGPISRVAGSSRVTFPTRKISSQPKSGQEFEVETPTHIVGVLDLASGGIVQMTMSFDVWTTVLPPIEIYGTKGTLLLPDPNGFGGDVVLHQPGEPSSTVLPASNEFVSNHRGLGVLDMIESIRNGRPHRASGERALHVLEVMAAVLQSSDQGEAVAIPQPSAVAFV